MRKKSIIIYLIIFILLLSGCSSKNLQSENNKSKNQIPIEKEMNLNIVTTNKLQYFMVRDIVKERHFVEYMFNTKERLWSFDYSEDSLKNISKKDLFFYSDTSLEPWSASFVDKLSKESVAPVDISRGIKLQSLSREITYKDITLKDNPYYWMNIDNYKIAMLNIKNAIQDKDTKDRDFYEANFSKAIKEVEEKQKVLKEVMGHFKDYTFLVDGDELDYFTSYYGLKTIKIHNFAAEASKENTEELEEAVKNLEDSKNLIYLYDSDEELKANQYLVERFNLKGANIQVYGDDIKYTDLLAHNIKNLEQFLQVK